ncbi:acyl carrier protein [Micromonospora sp. DR5-3]|uniref:acyl carrier protein n=1 Tax=unclassified Micromonospora TaxID=2617518 RepID=UPI0011DAD5B0|nr:MULTISPECIES: acyl carrier protein [unclassified Micromonospora]MCW3815815.1 acyl carrier protein [Micromonospora sp. DR5-3]TYC21203.1 acyl carrier protein [Micromonospora sp. MP36]
MQQSYSDIDSPALTTLLQCAAEVLRSSVAPTDHFLELGGDSLSALRLVALMSHHGLKLDVDDLFEQEDMASLSLCLTVTTAER